MAYTKASLNRSVENYCGQLRNRIKLTRQHRTNGKKWVEIWDYPIVASACSDGNYKADAHSGRMSQCNKHLKRALEKFGAIGKSPESNKIDHQIEGKLNPLGNCAEQHASGRVLTKQGLEELGNLFFGQARQVRDNALIPPCATCKNVFPQLR